MSTSSHISKCLIFSLLGGTTSSGGAPSTTTTLPPGCMHNPSDENSPCYLLNNEALTFQEAEDYCVGLGGHLASSLSAGENNFLANLFVRSSYWWIGARCGDGDPSHTCEGWAWTDGSSWDYHPWNNANDEQPGTSSCAILMQQSQKWMKLGCSRTFPFACKIWFNLFKVIN